MRPPRSHSYRPRLAVVLPAYDEAGIAGFLDEIEEHLRPHVGTLEFVVVDDASPEPLRDVLAAAPTTPATGATRVLTNATNLGHGPTALRAYAAGLATGADFVLHVDGDGQFDGRDFPPLLQALENAEVVHGERTGREDPWFRRVVTRLLRGGLARAVGPVRDVNTPLRGYRAGALAELLSRVDERATVPHVHLSVLVHQLGMDLVRLPVASRPRRGETATGTMWGPTRAAWLPSRRFLRFCAGAVRELAAADLTVRRPLVLPELAPALQPLPQPLPQPAPRPVLPVAVHSAA